MPFLVFEGLDGSGKSTLIQGICENLNSQNIDHHVTREPGGTALGEDIRHLLLRTEGEAPIPLAELFLYCADRSQHVGQVIQPKLKEGQWVLSDRYYASTLAFQCGGRNLDEKLVRELTQVAIQGTEPDLWILLDLTLDEAQRRQQMRAEEKGQELDRFEREAQDFHQRVRDHYLKLSQENPKQWLILDAAESPKSLLEKTLSELRRRGWLSS